MGTTRYRAIDRNTFRDAMCAIGFDEIVPDKTFEYAYDRAITARDGTPSRFMVRVLSSVSINTNVTRETGEDAIRVMLYDNLLGRMINDWRVLRTESALVNTVKRARDAFKYAIEAPRCQACSAIMIKRKSRMGGEFLGCTNYPTCKSTRPV